MDRFEGVGIWDGERFLGVGSVAWAPIASGRDARVTEIEVTDPNGEAELNLVPGLIDTHVHLVGFAGPDTGADAAPDFLGWPLVTRPEERTLHGLAQARRALVAGVTTVRDLSADDVQFSLRRAIDDGVVEGPRVLAHGMVGMTGGHADLFTPQAFPLRAPTADGPDACRALVRAFARAGADGIKVAASGGVLSVGDRAEWRNHTDAELAAIVDEAHALQLPVAAHAHSADGIRRALAHGVDSIEHATLLSAELTAAVVAAGVSVAPTLLINERIAAGARGAAAEKAAALVAERDRLLPAAAEAGVDFVLGTDANGRHVRFGEQPAELRRMAELFRWSAERALQAATSRAAAALRRQELGSIRVGAAADLLLLRGRPWLELGALDRIEAVVSRGREVHR